MRMALSKRMERERSALLDASKLARRVDIAGTSRAWAGHGAGRALSPLRQAAAFAILRLA